MKWGGNNFYAPLAFLRCSNLFGWWLNMDLIIKYVSDREIMDAGTIHKSNQAARCYIQAQMQGGKLLTLPKNMKANGE
ncbi:hypothetical protein DSCOOX_01080 [Desulfosarcina ovata subsp. ovata]|uniref:Uncharacterized protein n=1 Tax=Desulfosarcina ovata subsp. ovata TaxID=2752305 RepID=A0A5K8A3F4_9BACT|nr:hypothetical protein DSCOOX_01080 [Desulfosarcina ovata subsp. ovata]